MVHLEARLPARAGAAGAVAITPALTARAGASYVLWSELEDDDFESTDNRVELSLALLLQVNETLAVSASFFHTGWDGGGPLRGSDDALRYVAAGGVVRLGRTRVDVAVADTRLLSDVRQTLVRLGLSQSF